MPVNAPRTFCLALAILALGGCPGEDKAGEELAGDAAIGQHEGAATVTEAAPARDAAACTSLADTAAWVPVEMSADAFPEALAPRGGPISDGDYVLTAYKGFGASAADLALFANVRIRTAARVSQSGALLEQVGRFDFDSDETAERTMLKPSGSVLAMSRLCPPQNSPETVDYSASPSELVLILSDHGVRFATTFTKR
jgi:hypothetical protein